ncbi:hypothetical protein MSAN_02088300 [Mycena sanguinolenta]|uniref:Uncharacterized protein n=1 Tax=Mycena sanguinolenta TaxID=230812 RepID=A0A8H6XIC0_9AGAR|nr:hypothetical protein MSAN_02088300 [Mycena sanguinolenta]
MSILPDPSSPKLAMDAREQCLRNSDLLEEILGHLSSASDRQELDTQRRTLLWIASTSKDFSLSAIKFLWRRLDNLLPLLRLLPSFTKRDSIYCLFGAMTPIEWMSFDRHAKHVREIVYDDIPDTIHIEPSVYLRLSLRCSPILPNLRRFACSGTTSGPSASETFLYMQSPLRALELSSVGAMLTPIPGPSMEMTRVMVVSSLREKPSHISHLLLVAQPAAILCEGIPLDKVTSLELRRMNGAGLDPTLLRRIGSLPDLRSFTADSSCITDSAIRNLASDVFESTPPHFDSTSGGQLFTGLTHLRLNGDLTRVDSPVPLFLEMIGSSNLRSLTLQMARTWDSLVQAVGRGTRGAVPSVPIMHTISHRWSKSLRELDLEVSHSYEAILELLGGLPALCSLKLSGDVLQVPLDKSICSLFAGLRELETLSMCCRFCFGEWDPPVSLNLRSIAILAQMCPPTPRVGYPYFSRRVSSARIDPNDIAQPQPNYDSLLRLRTRQHARQYHRSGTPFGPNVPASKCSSVRHLKPWEGRSLAIDKGG